mgnify:CR=1 FL=1
MNQGEKMDLNYAIGIVAGKQPLTVDAVRRMLQFIAEAQPAPSRISLLDWHVPDPKRPAHDRFTRQMEDEHRQRAHQQFPWYPEVLAFTRDGVGVTPIRPLHERTDWTFRVFDRDWNDPVKDAKLQMGPEIAADPAAAGPCWWGKQCLIEDAIVAGCARILLLPLGGWMAPEAPAMLESGIDGEVVMTYPEMVVRCGIDGEPLRPLRGYEYPQAITAAHVAAGDSLAFDYFWIDLKRLPAGPEHRVCNFAPHDTVATLTRVLSAGGGRRVRGTLAFHPEIEARHKQAARRHERV